MSLTQVKPIENVFTPVAGTRMRCLRVALVLFGAIFLFGLYPLMTAWPSGWRWNPSQTEYEQMIVGVYATLGVFLIIASRNPLENRSLIWFTVWSSIVHGAVMAYQSITDTQQIGHLYGDVVALFVIAAILAYLMPKGRATQKF